MITLDELRTIEVFDSLPEEQLAWVAAHAEVRDLDAGALLFAEGDPADHMAVVLQGALQITFPQGGATAITQRKGGVTGILPYSRMTQYVGKGMATVPTRLLLLHRKHFQEMVQVCPELSQRLVAIMSTRVREFAKLQQQREKMMALGKLSAGLAHELNNPATAVRRAAGALQERFAKLSSLTAGLARHGLDADRLQHTARMCTAAGQHAHSAALSPLERSAREDELTDWLDGQGVAEGWLLAETFVEAGLTVEVLGETVADVPAEAVQDVLAWTEGMLAVQQLLEEITSASSRISELVASVKAYSHMDQAPDRQPTDVHEGLDNTLKMLGHKAKEKDVHLVRSYQPDLPRVPAYGGELNQVWTNLIDNALDALGVGGEVRLVTRQEGDNVFVDVIDDGGGIPPEVQSRIFEPFFTTKGVGEGTGLGLDIAQRIVSQHQGTINVASKPGRTVFTVCLPLNVESTAPVPEG